MITLGINEFIRNIRRNIFVIAQMIAIYMIAIFVISAFEEQYSLYSGMSDFLDDTGIVMLSSTAMEPTGNVVTYDGLNEVLDKVENIAISYRHDVFEKDYTSKDKTDTLNMQIIANDPSLVKYKPKLIDGTWCEDTPHKDGLINIVISNNSPFDFEVGDIINTNGLSFYITGIFDCEELVYGYSGRANSMETNYLHFYSSTMEYAIQNMLPPCLAVASYEDIEREINPYRVAFGKIVVDFEDNITDEEYDKNLLLLKEHYGYVENLDVLNSKIVYDNTIAHLEIKLLPMFVLLAIVLFVLIVSILTASAVNILYEKRNYGIYFICGNDWKKTFVISAVHWFSVSLASIVIAVSGCMLLKVSGKFEQLTLSFTPTHVWVLTAITIVTFIAALILPYNMLRKIQPVSILKENND